MKPKPDPAISPALAARLIVRAQAAGSRTTTLRGAVRYLHSAAITYTRPAAGPRNRVVGQIAAMPSVRPLTAAEYREAERRRTEHPEAKRARNDADFRRAYLAGLRREERRLCAAPTGGTLVAWSESLRRTTDRLREIATARSIATGRAATPATPATPILVTIDDNAAAAVGWRTYRRCSDRRVIPTAAPSRLDHVAAESECRGGRWRTAVSASARDYVRSVAVIDGGTCTYLAHQTLRTIALPAGWVWDVDANGLRALRVTDGADHHVTAADLLDGADEIIARAEEQAAARAAVEARVASEATAVAEVEVCAVDARRAGNCEAGIVAWAGQHALSLRAHVPAPVLLRMAARDPQESRVRLAVRVAAERHAREVQAGYCLVADHR